METLLRTRAGTLSLGQDRYNEVILPKVEEIVSLIEPSLNKLDIFLNPVIHYGVNQVSLEEMITKLSDNLASIHELSKLECCPGSVAKFLNRRNKPRLVCGIHAISNNSCNSLYVEKTKFACCELRFRLYMA